MSNIIKEVEIWRGSINYHYDYILLRILIDDRFYASDMEYRSISIEDEAVIQLLDDFVEEYQPDFPTSIITEQLRVKIIEGFRQLRDSDFDDHSERRHENLIISSLLEEQPELHFSCKSKKHEDSATQSSGENETFQSEIKQKLATFQKDGRTMKFFEDNKCSVCLSSYKEVLDENLHIVVPSCGHPLCCGCADNILKSAKKECPRCRGNITADSFNLMKC